MNNKKIAVFLPLLAVLLFGIIIASKKSKTYQQDKGMVFGTVYSITYENTENLKAEIEAVMDSVNNSLSPFNEKSVITMVNKSKKIAPVDDMFCEVFEMAEAVSKDTEGAFDITVAPLVNLWGFGFKSGEMPTDAKVDSLLKIVGFGKVTLVGKQVMKTDERVMLDCSAIAKGYAVDAVARMLRRKGIENFLVEIGGEIVASGHNKEDKEWRIGVTKPTDDSLNVENELQTVLKLTDIAMATSGNYRNFYYRDGKKFAHTIDPKTGRPIQHSLLSATVIASECAIADAYATSFMVMGMEKAKEVLKRHPDMMAYFIYSDAEGNNAVWYSEGMKKIINE